MAGHNSNLKLLCGLWKSVGKSGMEFLKGRTNQSFVVDAGHTILIFPNAKRNKENSPHFFMYSAPPLQGNAGDRVSPAQEGMEDKPVPIEQGKAEGSDDEVPF